MTKETSQQAWKSGNEYLPYHPQASHVNPDYRDGWNACYEASKAALPVQPAAIVARGKVWTNPDKELFKLAIAWANRHDISGNVTDILAMFDDARSALALPVEPAALPESHTMTAPVKALLQQMLGALTPLANAHFPDEREQISDDDVHKAGLAMVACSAALALPVEPATDKLLQIIAATYQIAGVYDAPEHVLDVLANPELATQEQIDALLPFNVPLPVETANSVVQEPVAWKSPGNHLVHAVDRFDNSPLVDWTPLYTHPQAAQPVEPAVLMLQHLLYEIDAEPPSPHTYIDDDLVPEIREIVNNYYTPIALPVEPANPILTMKPMADEYGTKGWFIDGPDFYCDIDKKPGESYEVFIRDKNGVEGFAEGKLALPVEPLVTRESAIKAIERMSHYKGTCSNAHAELLLVAATVEPESKV